MIKITYFVHGTTIDNELGLASGWDDVELSDLGVNQAKQLGQQIKTKKFDAIFCSDLKRSIDSAKLAFGKQTKIIVDRRLREANYGEFTKLPADRFKNRLTDYLDKPFPGGESYLNVEQRLTAFLEYLKTQYDRKHIAIVAHQAPQLALEVLLNGKTWPQAINQDWRKTKGWQPGWDYILV
ncbi:MAG: histidine phosphatase family protein [Patescibacteria group bacterium]|jgi:broad specificity phosphatase PhoE|nr:histidine phosphatase family protein [Patescibacteria group bacterium]